MKLIGKTVFRYGKQINLDAFDRIMLKLEKKGYTSKDQLNDHEQPVEENEKMDGEEDDETDPNP